MTQSQTETKIRSTARRLFAERGYDGLSMRVLSKESGIGLSSIYHFFDDKDVLLKAIYAATNTELGLARKTLRERPTAERMLADRIEFQFDHMEEIVFVLKYYMHFRHEFAALPSKTLPPKSVLHIEEVLYKGLSSGEFMFSAVELPRLARMVAHMINGFMLEYYPDAPRGQERKNLVSDMTGFAMSALIAPRHKEGMPM